ncbi:MAG: Rrf2 family transcriptional regulator [Treponema sp.]|jgi:Rrf2 family iron-sulfur cluster assembly transcriptional regulator|nr:Rrf2 family transcriptional regulator [Treponema sp.]
MRLTTRGRYALRATLALAKLSKDGASISIGALAEAEEISSVFLEQIFVKLKKAGIVNSVRGPGGGFSFALPLEEITVKAVLDAAGEDLSVSSCDKQDDCDRVGSCISHRVIQEMTSLINKYFASLTLASLLEHK